MSQDVFEKLASNLGALPEQIEEAYDSATVDAINIAAEQLRTNLLQKSKSSTLNAAMVSIKIDRPKEYYERGFDWDDERIVNIEQGKSVGKYKDRPRKAGKRNYSLHPATYHDLAYIINFGHGGKLGNYFITKSMRRVKNWKNKRDIDFERRLAGIAKDLEEE